MAVEVALVSEPGGGRGAGDRLPGFQQAPRGADAVGDVQRVRRQTGPLPEQGYEAELADAGRGGELVEPDVAFGPVVSPSAARRRAPTS